MRTLTLTLVLASVFFFTACGAVKIGRINADPSRFRNQTVHVTGSVVNSVGVLGTGGYQLEDGTGRIFVLSRTGVPSRGSRVTVTGKVIPGAEILGQAVGTAIREDHHQVK